MRRYDESAQDFADAVKLDLSRTDEVLLLHLAQSRGGKSDASDFTANTLRLDPTKWPAPLVQLYSGKASGADALSAGARAQARCEAAFFVAEDSVLRNKAAFARDGFLRTENACDRWSFERYIARAELAR